MVLVSAMQIHSGPACQLVADACRLDEQRALIVVGGPKAAYEPWDFFDRNGGASADVAITGEVFAFMELLERLLEHKASTETLRDAFHRLRRENLLADIPGLVYRSRRTVVTRCPPMRCRRRRCIATCRSLHCLPRRAAD
jgi:radical SAM superfamily enzyme YgiQ (UPF0313 family)